MVNHGSFFFSTRRPSGRLTLIRFRPEIVALGSLRIQRSGEALQMSVWNFHKYAVKERSRNVKGKECHGSNDQGLEDAGSTDQEEVGISASLGMAPEDEQPNLNESNRGTEDD